MASSKEIIPRTPQGWLELRSLEPIILTWAKAGPEKSLDQVPTIMVQVFQKTEKIVKLFIDQKLDNKKCFETEKNGWKQIWCSKHQEAYVILTKNESAELAIQRQRLLSWIHDHD